ncbi:MAG: 4'-phosphopantetheinyl transferase superfamily protein [Gammaproteobacteria bacterium]|nr:4'-phosphopantetheinyl transferase superfamily protein [Gammaproteobacteria bacterium]
MGDRDKIGCSEVQEVEMRVASSEIHLWICRSEQVKEFNLLSGYYDMLSADEREQHDRFFFEKHRNQYLVTRAMIRTVLSQYARDIAPEQWEFEKNEYGKPYASNSNLKIPLKFNLSHTDELTVAAITLGGEVGVDVEKIKEVEDIPNIVNSYFSPIEREQLTALPFDKQTERFFDLWTLKESYIKACGKGLSMPLDLFSFSICRHGSISIEFSPKIYDKAERWHFWQIQYSNIHKMSLAKMDCGEKEQKYSVRIRNIVPGKNIREVDLPISYKKLITH